MRLMQRGRPRGGRTRSARMRGRRREQVASPAAPPRTAKAVAPATDAAPHGGLAIGLSETNPNFFWHGARRRRALALARPGRGAQADALPHHRRLVRAAARPGQAAELDRSRPTAASAASRRASRSPASATSCARCTPRQQAGNGFAADGRRSTACPTGPRRPQERLRAPRHRRPLARDQRQGPGGLREDGRARCRPWPRPRRSTSAGGARGTSPTARSSSRPQRARARCRRRRSRPASTRSSPAR